MKSTTTLSDNLTTGLTVLQNAPDVSFSSDVALSDNDDIKTLNALFALGTIGGVSGTITDTAGANLLADDAGDATKDQLTPTTADSLTVDFGTVAAATLALNEIEDLAQMNGTHTITGTVTSVDATQAETIGNMTDPVSYTHLTLPTILRV